MRRIRNQTTEIVWHCSATPPSRNIHVADIDRMHKDRGWEQIGYHVVISRGGGIQWGENPRRAGAHAKGHNLFSIAVCLVGGVDEDGDAENNFTPEQWESATLVYRFLSRVYPAAEHLGHRDLSPDRDGDGRIERHEFMKGCPCFSVKQWIDGDLEPVSDLFAPWEMDDTIALPEPKPRKRRTKKVKKDQDDVEQNDDSREEGSLFKIS